MLTLYRRRRRTGLHEPPPFRRKASLLKPEEQAYIDTLSEVVGSSAQVFAKVRLSDLLVHPGSDTLLQEHWRRVQRRCVDFLICSPTTLSPVIAVKLENRAQRRHRQTHGVDLLERVLDAAQLPLLRVPVREAYDAVEVARSLRLTLAASGAAMNPEQDDDDCESPPPFPTRGILRFANAQMPTLSRWSSGLWVAVRGLGRRRRPAAG